MIFKKANFSEDIAFAMENNMVEASSVIDKHKLAIAYLMDAAEYFDLAGMSKEAEITTKLIQKIAEAPEIVTPQIVHDVFDPQREYTPHVSGPKKIYDADELIQPKEEKFIDPTPYPQESNDPFQLKEPKEKVAPAKFVSNKEYGNFLKTLRKHERMTRFLEGHAQEHAKNEYVASMLFLKSIVDGIPDPTIFTKYKMPHAPQWAADMSLIPKDTLERLLKQHLENTGGGLEGLETAYPGRQADRPQTLRGAVYPDKGGTSWIAEFSNGDTGEYSTKEKAEAAARGKATTVVVSDHWIPGGRF